MAARCGHLDSSAMVYLPLRYDFSVIGITNPRTRDTLSGAARARPSPRSSRDFLFDFPSSTRFLDRRAFLCKVQPALLHGVPSGAGRAPVSPPASMQRPERPFSLGASQTLLP